VTPRTALAIATLAGAGLTAIGCGQTDDNTSPQAVKAPSNHSKRDQVQAHRAADARAPDCGPARGRLTRTIQRGPGETTVKIVRPVTLNECPVRGIAITQTEQGDCLVPARGWTSNMIRKAYRCAYKGKKLDLLLDACWPAAVDSRPTTTAFCMDWKPWSRRITRIEGNDYFPTRIARPDLSVDPRAVTLTTGERCAESGHGAFWRKHPDGSWVLSARAIFYDCGRYGLLEGMHRTGPVWSFDAVEHADTDHPSVSTVYVKTAWFS
jgi:hypothetical protein